MAQQHEHRVVIRRQRLEEMPPGDRALVERAAAAAAGAYAPYSGFRVGAALRLGGGEVAIGSNQENASFPAGLCAERTALHHAMALHPGGRVEAIAVAVPQLKGPQPAAPCGICRQALLEQEVRQGAPLRVLMASGEGTVLEAASAADLLPLHFDASFLKP